MEIFEDQEMIKAFQLEDVNRSNALWSPETLEWPASTSPQPEPEESPKKKRKWLRRIVLLVVISGIAAAIGIFMFSISTFMSSESLQSFNLNKLSAKNVQEKLQNTNPSANLIAEDDTSNENEEVDLPKIHLVGGKK